MRFFSQKKLRYYDDDDEKEGKEEEEVGDDDGNLVMAEVYSGSSQRSQRRRHVWPDRCFLLENGHGVGDDMMLSNMLMMVMIMEYVFKYPHKVVVV